MGLRKLKNTYIDLLKNALALLVFGGVLFSINKANAQETLTLQDAIKIALEKSYDILLVKNENKIYDNNVSIGNAGMLPQANVFLTTNNNILDTRQTLQSGVEQERTGAKNSNMQYGVALNWTVFDGFGMFARYEQLKELEKFGEANLQLRVLTTVADVASTYYTLVQQQQQLKALDTAVSLSRYRVTIAQSRFEIGKSSRLEVLNAQVDFNTDTTNLLRQQETYNNTQTQMNLLLGRDVTTRFRVVEDVVIDDKLAFAQLLENANKQNPALQSSVINRRVAELDLKNIRSGRFPTLTLNSGYNFTDNRSALGFATHSTGRGPYYGVTASVNIFNGFNQNRLEKNASVLVENSQIEYEQQKQELSSQLASAYQNYQTNLALVKMEESNLRIAEQNLDITMEKYRIGSITTLEVRTAQLNYIDATTRFTNAQLQAKLAEIGLKEIAGNMNF